MTTSTALAHKRRLQKEAREVKANAKQLEEENRIWEEAEAIADEDDFQQLLKKVEIESSRMTDTDMAPTTAGDPTANDPTLDRYCTMEETRAHLLAKNKRLQRQLTKLKAKKGNSCDCDRFTDHMANNYRKARHIDDGQGRN